MRKYFCDACGKEVKSRDITGMAIPCHLWSFRGKSGYADIEGNSVSGRSDTVELCNSCLNTAYSAAVSKIEEIKQKAKL